MALSPRLRALGGLFNQLFSPSGVPLAGGYKVVSWNARGLFALDKAVRRKKLRFLDHILRRVQILHVQETHGSAACIDQFLFYHARKFWIRGSFCENAAGGVITFISKELAPTSLQVLFEPIVPGRVARTEVLGNHSSQTHWNIHNYGLSPADMAVSRSEFTKDVARSRRSPLVDLLFLLGDLNSRNSSTSLFPYLNSSQVGVTDAELAPDGRLFFMQDLLDELLELTQPLPTHYWPPTATGAAIDRAFTSVPVCLVPVALWNFYIYEDPYSLYTEGISDHAPIVLEVRNRTGMHRDSQPISKDILTSEHFRFFHDILFENFRLAHLDPLERLFAHKLVIRRAAKLAREKLQDLERETPEGTVKILTTITRIFWSQDHVLARRLIGRSPVARQHLAISGRVVSFRDPVLFNNSVVEARNLLIRTQLEQAPLEKNKSNKGQLLSRLAKLWVPFKKNLIIAGIRSKGTVHRGACMFDALADAWAPTFSWKPIDQNAALKVLELASRNIPLPPPELLDATPPTNDTYDIYMKRLRDSGTGPDGLPYSAWAATGQRGTDTLRGAGDVLNSVPDDSLERDSFLLEFNASFIHFAPKGEEEADVHEVIRNEMDARPLSLKNTDNKIITGAHVVPFRAFAKNHTHKYQRGFVPGRNFLGNVVDLDAAARFFQCML